MTAAQFKGMWKQVKGEIKQRWGNLTDDRAMTIEAKYDKFVGRVQERYGDKKDDIVHWADDWCKREQDLAAHSFTPQTGHEQDSRPVH